MTPVELVAAYETELARLRAISPEPPPSRRLVDFILAPFGRDARSYARAERTRLLASAAREAAADLLCARGWERHAARAAVDDALRRREARPDRAGAARGRP